MMIQGLWLLGMLAGMAWWVRRDAEAYRRFQALTSSGDRQRVYWGWIAQSFAILVGASLISLWLVDGLSPFNTFPSAFEQAHQALRSPQHDGSAESMAGMAIGFAIGLAMLMFMQWRRIRKMLKPVAGPADALLPRNRREAMIVTVLSLNAGFSEELFFRLALPLFLFHLTGSLWIAFGVAGVCFGLAHAYQGWKGVLGTMLVGGGLTLIYLSHGSLLRVMLIHAVIDIMALLVRPAITRWIGRRNMLAAAGA